MKKLILTLLTLCILPAQANALSCVGPEFEHDLAGAETVFEGRVTKVETVFGKEHLNKLTAIVETPYQGVEKGEEITIYQKHWEFTEKPWQESDDEKREGIFLLSKTNSADTNLGFWFDQDIYLIGMCQGPYWIKTEENEKLLTEKFSE